jgi:hypothetical protein
MDELTKAQREEMQRDLATFGWVSCPKCGWSGLSVTKDGKLRKHGRAQTGNGGLGCTAGGLRIR